jgi:hypothetical protein
VKNIKCPKSFPHISIYYSTNVKFKTYDVIVATYDLTKERYLYGFQLKEEKGLPESDLKEDFHMSYVIRGQSQKKKKLKSHSSVNKWIIPNEEIIKEFFGVSGQKWTLIEWKKLCWEENQKKRKNESPYKISDKAEVTPTKKGRISCCNCKVRTCQNNHCSCKKDGRKCSSCQSENCTNVHYNPVHFDRMSLDPYFCKQS